MVSICPNTYWQGQTTCMCWGGGKQQSSAHSCSLDKCGVFAKGCALLKFRVYSHVGWEEWERLDWSLGFLPLKSRSTRAPRWRLAFERAQVVSHMIKFRLSCRLQVYCGSLFLLQHTAHYTKHNIFASYIQQFYFLLSFVQQNKSATTLKMLLAFKNTTPKQKKKKQPLTILLCWVMISFYCRRSDILVFTKVKTSFAFRYALSLSVIHRVGYD